MKTTTETINQEVQESVNNDFLVNHSKRQMKELLKEYSEVTGNSWTVDYEKSKISNKIIKENHFLEKRIRVVQRSWVRAFKNYKPEIADAIILQEWTK